ncbi:MAG: class I tRNA ligase family protein, partial [Bacilli bacterium]|nr:class I tRNA ligase family protein [Bacilli bacterium]
EKMSKSKGNVINPDDIVKEYGADTLRCYEMFMGDYQMDAPWSTESLKGCDRFLKRIERLGENLNDKNGYTNEALVHKTIKKVTEDYSTLKYNTAIASLMTMLNEYEKFDGGISKDDYRVMLILLNPVAPHITEELNEMYQLGEVLCKSSWPEYDEEKTKESSKVIGVQVNGKLRGEVEVTIDDSEESVQNRVLEIENIQKYIAGKPIVKFIYVPNKIVNIIVKG